MVEQTGENAIERFFHFIHEVVKLMKQLRHDEAWDYIQSMQEKAIETAGLHTDELILVGRAPPPDDPPLRIGDVCKLNSGGFDLLVVGAGEDTVTVAHGLGGEHLLPRACVRRVTRTRMI